MDGFGRRSVFGFTSVFDVSDVSAMSIVNMVSHNLESAIGKSNTVFARGSISVTVFILTKVSSRVVIGHSILVIVHRRDIGISGGRSVGRGSGRGSQSGSKKGGEGNDGLKIELKYSLSNSER